MPNFAKPQSLNRYSYVSDSPASRVDPSGHCDESIPPGDRGADACWRAYSQASEQLGSGYIQGLSTWSQGRLEWLMFWLSAGVRFVAGGGSVDDGWGHNYATESWTADDIGLVLDAFVRVAGTFGTGATQGMLGVGTTGLPGHLDFYKIEGNKNTHYNPFTNAVLVSSTIRDRVTDPTEVVLHELGHAADWHSGYGKPYSYSYPGDWLNAAGWECQDVFCSTVSQSAAGQAGVASIGGLKNPQEDFADMFVWYIETQGAGTGRMSSDTPVSGDKPDRTLALEALMVDQWGAHLP